MILNSQVDGLTDKRYVGKTCAEHPELGGLRLKSNSRCVQCHRDIGKEREGRGYDYEVWSAARKRRKLEDKIAAFDFYGWQCQTCGCAEPHKLTIDHVDQRGGEHARCKGERYRGWFLYHWLRMNDFPQGYRTLCRSCNAAIFRLHKKDQLKSKGV